MSKLKPFFCYYGGKWRDAKHYPRPSFNTIVEPFAGAAGYSLNYPDTDVFLFDLDPVIVGVWAYLIRSTHAEISALPLLEQGQTVHDLSVCQEAKHLIGFWLNKGSSAPCLTPSAWMRSGTRPNSYWGSAIRRRIAEQVGQIKHWKVQCVSYDALPTPDATWFVDPPYQHAGKHYRKGSSGIDFTALGGWCSRLPGQVIVCENEGADWLPFRPHRDIRATPKGERSDKTRSLEVIWTNT